MSISTMRVFESASLEDFLNDEICDHIIQETKTVLQSACSPEAWQRLLPQLCMIKNVHRFMVLELYKENHIDKELADLLCSESDQFSRIPKTKSITQENKERLEKTIYAAREKIKNLFVMKKIDRKIAKQFLPILVLDKCVI